MEKVMESHGIAKAQKRMNPEIPKGQNINLLSLKCQLLPHPNSSGGTSKETAGTSD